MLNTLCKAVVLQNVNDAKIEHHIMGLSKQLPFKILAASLTRSLLYSISSCRHVHTQLYSQPV